MRRELTLAKETMMKPVMKGTQAMRIALADQQKISICEIEEYR